MKKGAYIFVLVLFLIGGGTAMAAKPVCGDGTCQGNEANTCPQDCPGGGGDPSTCVTLADFVGEQAMNLTDDAAGNYCDDERGVGVQLGDVSFSISINAKKATRHIELELDPTCLSTGVCSIGDVSGVNTTNMDEYSIDPVTGVFSSTGGHLDLLAMPAGTTAYVGLRIAFPSNSKSTPHLVAFGHNGPFDCVAAGGAPVKVERGLSPDNVWTFTATFAENDLACLLEVESGNTRVFQGLVSVPLHMTVVVE